MKASNDKVKKAYDMICKRINSILAEAARPASMKEFVILADNTLAVRTKLGRICEVGILKEGPFGQWMKVSSDALKKKDLLVDLFLKSAKKHDVILIGFFKAVIKKGETIENLIVEHDMLLA